MDANLVMTLATGLGITGGGVWALVKWRGNGHRTPESPPAWQVEMMRELQTNFGHLSGQFDRFMRNVEEDRSAWLKTLATTADAGIPPAWQAMMMHEVQQSLKHFSEQVSGLARSITELPSEFERNSTRLSEQLGAFIRTAEEDRAPWQAELLRELDELSESLRAAEHRAFGQQPLPPIVRPRSAEGDNGGAVVPKALPPAGRRPPLTLEMFNTITMVANEVYELFPPEAGLYWLNIANLGPGTVYTRINADPSVGDPQSVTLPVGAADNNIHVPLSLRALADVETTIIVRLATQ